MSIQWVALLASLCVAGMMTTIGLRNAKPSQLGLEGHGRCMMALCILLVGAIAVLFSWDCNANTVVLETQPQQQDVHFLLDTHVEDPNFDGTFCILQVRNRMQYCYVNENAELAVGTMDKSIVELVFDDYSCNYVTISKELQTTRREWGFLWGPKQTEEKILGYELHIPSTSSIFAIG